jgi:hypothetical protein
MEMSLDESEHFNFKSYIKNKDEKNLVKMTCNNNIKAARYFETCGAHMHLRGHHGLQIVRHFTICNRGNFLSRYINQTANLCATNRIKQNGGRVC